MGKFKKSIAKIILAIVFIVISIILLVPKNKKENFRTLTGFTSETLYRDLKDLTKFDARIKDPSFIQTADDRYYELIMKRCYQNAGITIEQIIQLGIDRQPCYAQSFQKITSDFSIVKTSIINNIQTAHDTLLNNGTQAPIHGPVYVMIYQVPYYKNSLGQDISLQSFNVSQYNFLSTNKSGIQNIFYYVEIYYGRYAKNGSLMTIDKYTSQIPGNDAIMKSFEPQCFMVGNGNTDGPNVYPGCASSRGLLNGLNTATCLGPIPGNSVMQNDSEDKKNTVSTYGVLYTVNTLADSIKRYFYQSGNPALSTPWQTIDENIQGNALFRMNDKGDVQCLSNNSSTCLTDVTPQVANAAPFGTYKPYTCTANTYTQGQNICSIGKQALTI